jgi:hypothetical protein
MIIIEGPDGSGKSTLAETLKKELGFYIIHPGGPPKDEEVLARMSEQLAHANNPIHWRTAYDRVTCVSHPIYQKIDGAIFKAFRRQTLCNPYTFLIYCRPPNKNLDLSNHIPKPYDTVDHLAMVSAEQPRIVEDYDRMMKDYDHYPYDYTANDLDFIVTQIKRRIR